MLRWTLDRLSASKMLNAIVVATSDETSDDAVAEFCGNEGITCFRGSLNDVASRFLAVSEIHDARQFVRISGDSPLIDPALLDYAISLFRQGECDLVTNVQMRTFPKGQSVEVVLTSALRRAYEAMVDPLDFEHVTRAFYLRQETHRIVGFTSGSAFGSEQLSVDTVEDFHAISQLLEDCGGKPGGWRDLVALRGSKT